MNRKVIDYEIVQSDGLWSLQRCIKARLSKGYQPYGELNSFENDEGDVEFYQAMVKYEEEVESYYVPYDEGTIKGIKGYE
jgi:hypothetical protein